MNECLILAGGLGTRLRSVINDRPKCLARIHDKTFIDYLIFFLIKNNVKNFVFSLGHQSEQIVNHLNVYYKNKINYTTVIEKEQLGTGGAILNSIHYCKSDDVLILNADTFFNFDLSSLFDFHFKMNSYCSIALKEMKNFNRYGSVLLNNNNQVVEFEEKTYKEEGNINSGFILLNKRHFLSKNLPVKFSFENDYLKNEVSLGKTYGIILVGEFIDIGIPEDYEKSANFFNKLK